MRASNWSPNHQLNVDVVLLIDSGPDVVVAVQGVVKRRYCSSDCGFRHRPVLASREATPLSAAGGVWLHFKRINEIQLRNNVKKNAEVVVFMIKYDLSLANSTSNNMAATVFLLPAVLKRHLSPACTC